MQRSVRHGREIWLCEEDQRTAAIPVWMTDRAACAALSTGPILVSVEALTELTSLVNAARSAHDRITHPSKEEPDATSPAETSADPIRARCTDDRAAGTDRRGPGQGVAELLLASAGDTEHDEERDDAREDHR